MMKNSWLFFTFFFAIACHKNENIVVPVEELTNEHLNGAWISDETPELKKVMCCITSTYWYGEEKKNLIKIYDITEQDTFITFDGTFNVSNGVLFTYSESNQYANKILEFKTNTMTTYSSTAQDNKRLWKKTNSILYPPEVNYNGTWFYGKNDNGACYWKDLELNQITGVSKNSHIAAMEFKNNLPVFIIIENNSYSNNNTLYYWENNQITEIRKPVDYYANIYGLTVLGNDVYVAGAFLIDGGIKTIAGYWKNGVWDTLTSPKMYDNKGVLKESRTFVTDICSDGSNVYISGYSLNWSSTHSVACYWKNGVRIELETPESSVMAGAMGIKFINGHLYIPGYSNTPCYWIDGRYIKLPFATDGYAEKIVITGKDTLIAGVAGTGVQYLICWENSKYTFSYNFAYSAHVTSVALIDDIWHIHATGTHNSNENYTIWKISKDLKIKNSSIGPFNNSNIGKIMGIIVP